MLPIPLYATCPLEMFSSGEHIVLAQLLALEVRRECPLLVLERRT
jgi:hypothetical protein